MSGIVTQVGMFSNIVASDPLGALYFFDASDSANITSTGGSPNLLNTWDSVGGPSDIGVSLSQATTANKPRWDGSKVSFMDSSDLLTPTPNITTAGWVIVGTSKGTFAYKTNTTAWSAMGVLGMRAFFNQSGDMYGIKMLPTTATESEIQDVRAAFIASGAADAVVGTSMTSWWRSRTDISEFLAFDTSGISNWANAFQTCSGLLTWPAVNINIGVGFSNFLNGCSGLLTWPAGVFDSWNPSSVANNCFVGAWNGTTSLDATGVENIFDSIVVSGKSAPGVGTDITVSYNVSTGTPDTAASVATLKSRGWTPRLNGTLL